MKHYIQFKTLSTGYVEGSVPPRFDESHVKPIDKLGSDGIYHLDNRLNRSSMFEVGLSLCKQRKNKVGFSLCSYTTSILDSKEIFTHLF